jgi:hypothetical protein
MSHSTPLAKVYSIQPHLDVPELARIQFPMWLKSVYNIAQMELTTLDILGAFYLVVALDADWDIRPEKLPTQQSRISTTTTIRCPHYVRCF